MSTHICPCVKVNLLKHPNADTLSIVKVLGYQVVVKTEEWKDGMLGIYVPPDSVLPFRNPLFDWFIEKYGQRVRVKKFRGEISQGLLVQAPSIAREREDWAERLGIQHYEPTMALAVGFSTQTDMAPGPPGLYLPKYDIERWANFHSAITEKDTVYVTEKIHGTSSRFLFMDDEFYVGSRNLWKKDVPGCVYWECTKQHPAIREWCEKHPDYVLYGEVFGWVQKLRYGARPGQLFFAAFDVFHSINGAWLEYPDFCEIVPSILRVPELYVGLFDLDKLRELAEKNSEYVDDISEGIVFGTIPERTERGLGRCKLKIVSNRYYERG